MRFNQTFGLHHARFRAMLRLAVRIWINPPKRKPFLTIPFRGGPVRVKHIAFIQDRFDDLLDQGRVHAGTSSIWVSSVAGLATGRSSSPIASSHVMRPFFRLNAQSWSKMSRRNE